MTLKALWPDRTSNAPRDFKFTGEWYVGPTGVLILQAMTQTGWDMEDYFEVVDVHRLLPWRKPKAKSILRWRSVPAWTSAWIPEHDFVEVNKCGIENSFLNTLPSV